MDIFPSLLTQSQEEFKIQLDKVLPYFNRLQIDVADNILVKGVTTTSYEALQQLFLNSEARHATFDFHLMVKEFNNDLSMIQDAVSRLNIRFVLIHEAAQPPVELFLRQPYFYQLGLVLNPEDSVDTILHKYPVEKIPVIQIMTVYPGAQGRPFMPILLNKIDQLRSADYKGQIMLDGAINETTLRIILKRKLLPDAVCPGSYFSKSDNVKAALEKLTEERDRATAGS